MTRSIGHTIIVMMLAAIAALAVQYANDPAPAGAHTVTEAMCKADAQQPPAASRDEWRKRIRACRAYAARHNARHECAKAARPLVPRGVTVKGQLATTRPGAAGRGRQRQVLTEVLNVGRRKRANRTVMLSSIVAITAESSAQELRYGDGSSLGPFQIISGWGPAHSRIDATWSARWYFPTAITINRRRPWLTPPQLAQAVQASAHPGAYAPWLPEARRTYQRYLGPCWR